jgi:hypothetical protein
MKGFLDSRRVVSILNFPRSRLDSNRFFPGGSFLYKNRFGKTLPKKGQEHIFLLWLGKELDNIYRFLVLINSF